ncbi:MAG: hypothetical protein OEX11_02530 [Nitrosomonas sp.]|nr:hypothetical protein [Nitrosomonas sp.]
MKKWTDEELISTRDNLEEWKNRYNKTRSGSKLWLFTAFLGAFAVSTGLAFIFIDGVTALSILLIVMGAFTCYSWFRSEKQKNDNETFLADINKEIKRRKKVASKSKNKNTGEGKTKKDEPIEAVAEVKSEKPSQVEKKKKPKKKIEKKVQD